MARAVDDHFLYRYRELLDAEEQAFDELEHASEDGDREHYDAEWDLWVKAVEAKVAFLAAQGVIKPQG